MKFWFFMFFFILLIPLLMIIFGLVFRKCPPKEVNYIYGYRTPLSTKSQETWDFAHKYMGRLWLLFGIIILIPSIIGMVLVIGLDEDTVGYTGMVITLIQLFVMMIPIIPTERALKKNFDENGNRKNENF
ncbi:MAG: SdpI family protein [Clostridia bacterium]|nr:SdpI family protein [Clostridia bacterium]